MARTLALALLALVAAACASKERPKTVYRDIVFRQEAQAFAEFDRAEPATPDVLLVPFENRTALPEAARVVEERLLAEIREAGFTVKRIGKASAAPADAIVLQGRIAEYSGRGDEHRLRGAIRVHTGSFDSRWNWEARAIDAVGIPLQELADQISVKSLLRPRSLAASGPLAPSRPAPGAGQQH